MDSELPTDARDLQTPLGALRSSAEPSHAFPRLEERRVSEPFATKALRMASDSLPAGALSFSHPLPNSQDSPKLEGRVLQSHSPMETRVFLGLLRWSLFLSQVPLLPSADSCGRVQCLDSVACPVSSLLFLRTRNIPNLLTLPALGHSSVHVLEPPDNPGNFSTPLPLQFNIGLLFFSGCHNDFYNV